MKIATVNTRFWHWAFTDAAHQVKTGEILWLIRREKLDVLLLSDVHTANSGRLNTSHTTVALALRPSYVHLEASLCQGKVRPHTPCCLVALVPVSSPVHNQYMVAEPRYCWIS